MLAAWLLNGQGEVARPAALILLALACLAFAACLGILLGSAGVRRIVVQDEAAFQSQRAYFGCALATLILMTAAILYKLLAA